MKKSKLKQKLRNSNRLKKNLIFREDLVSLLLNANLEDNPANEYFRLIQDEFLSFANQESSLKRKLRQS